MRDVLIALVIGASGALFLHAFYRTVRLEWPQSYYSLGDVTSYRLSTSPLKYCSFRFGPVFVVAVFVTVVADRAAVPSWIAIASLVAAHIALTSGRATVDLVRTRTRRFNRGALLLSHAVITVGVVVVSVLAGVGSPFFAPAIPELADLSSDLWTALAAAVLGGYLVTVSRSNPPELSSILADARRRLTNRTWELAGEEARRHGSDPDLVRAILLAESLQRPEWLRILERLKGRFIKEGTYGVMQVRASRPIGDDESIRIAVREHLAGTSVPVAADGYPDLERLDDIIRSYNSDSRFVEIARQAWFMVREGS